MRWIKVLQLHSNRGIAGIREIQKHSLNQNGWNKMFASEPASKSHFEGDDGQKEQPRELRKGKEQRGWINEANWAIYVKQNFHVDRRSPFIVSIFRVPSILMQDTEKREAYAPKRVSLGPYHHTSAKLSPVDSHKEIAMYRMMARFNIKFSKDPFNMDFSVRSKDEILQLEDEISDVYEEKINCQGKSLASMLILDSCFILEILRTLSGDRLPGASNYYESIFEENKIGYTGRDILHDILKLENQIPLIVLRKLLQLELKLADVDVNKELLQVLLPSFLISFYPFDYKKDIKQWCWPQQEVHHLLGLLHRFVVSPHTHNDESAGDNYRRPPHQYEDKAVIDLSCNIHPTVELANAGIKFERCDGGINNIKFDQKSATIYLPPIRICDSTEILFRNLIAFEMCKPSEFNYVACYVCLMDQLIDSEEDVALLRRKGIVINRLGSDGEVAKLFNCLCKGTNVNLKDVFEQLTQKVKVHYNNKHKVYFAELVKEHFSSPWKILGLTGAIALLLLTFVQTIISILTFYK